MGGETKAGSRGALPARARDRTTVAVLLNARFMGANRMARLSAGRRGGVNAASTVVSGLPSGSWKKRELAPFSVCEQLL